MDDDHDNENLAQELRTLLGDDGYFVLVKRFGGVRLYLPELAVEDAAQRRAEARRKIVDELGPELVARIAAKSPVLNIPGGVIWRAHCLRHVGATDAEIARRLRISVDEVHGALWHPSINRKTKLELAVGKDDFAALVNAFPGSSFKLTAVASAASKIREELGDEIAVKLMSAYPPGLVLRIPLAREFKAQRLRAQGLSNAKIAVRLGITETGVDKLFRRMRGAEKQRKAANDDRRRLSAANDDDRPRRRLIRAAGDE